MTYLHSAEFDAWKSVDWLRIARRSGSLTKISIHVYQNSVESFVKQREVVFEVRMYTFIEFLIRLSLGLNSYVHRSAVSAPKSEDEHVM